MPRITAYSAQPSIAQPPGPRHRRRGDESPTRGEAHLAAERLRESHRLGTVFPAPLDVVLGDGDYVQPDILLIRKERSRRCRNCRGVATRRGCDGSDPPRARERPTRSSTGLETGEPVEVELHGRRVRIDPEAPPARSSMQDSDDIRVCPMVRTTQGVSGEERDARQAPGSIEASTSRMNSLTCSMPSTQRVTVTRSCSRST